MLCVVRRHHFRSFIGSPATSCRRRYSIAETISGVFFRRNASSTPPPRSAGHDVVVEQLLTASGHSMGIPVEEVRQQRVAATAKFNGFQARVKSPLLLVEETVEQENRCFH